MLHLFVTIFKSVVITKVMADQVKGKLLIFL